MSLDTFMEEHPWQFAAQFAALTLISDNPDSNLRFEYAFPADALVISQLSIKDVNPLIERFEFQKIYFQEKFIGASQRILTNLQDAYAVYTTQLSEDAPFPNHFAKGFSYQLAMDIGPQLITNNWPKVKDTLIPLAKNEISEAIAKDLGRAVLKQDAPNQFLAARYN
jgi:hypothetical protein